jgi:hypothetical protein
MEHKIITPGHFLPVPIHQQFIVSPVLSSKYTHIGTSSEKEKSFLTFPDSMDQPAGAMANFPVPRDTGTSTVKPQPKKKTIYRHTHSGTIQITYSVQTNTGTQSSDTGTNLALRQQLTVLIK